MCVLLIAYLARRTGVWAQASPPRKPARSEVANRDRDRERSEELARFDPVVKLGLLRELESRPAPHFNRNPFEYSAPKLPPKPPVVAAEPVVPAAPPAPPIKALGYMEKAGGGREGTITDDADNIYVVHEGQTFADRYKVLKITPTVIEVEDSKTQQTIQLPVPQ